MTIGVLNGSSARTLDLSGRGAVASAEMAIADFGPIVLGRPTVLLKADHQAKADLGVSLYEREQRMPNSLQASVHGGVTHYLRAVQTVQGSLIGTIAELLA